jgi:FtsP/CotA-like multicopper oxidase with cupredoxin domain
LEQPNVTLSRRTALLGLTASVFVAKQPAIGQEKDAPATAPSQRIALTAATLTRKIKPDAEKEAACLAFNGSIPGPLIRFKRGEAVAIALKNETDEPITFHPYGVLGDHAQDGVAGLSQEPIAPGASGETMLASADAGLYWYHSLVPGRLSSQLERGLYGPIIIEEANPPAFDTEIVVMIDDLALEPSGTFKNTALPLVDAARGGTLGNVLTVNGKPAPERMTLPAGSRIRLRIIGASNARLCPLKFDSMTAWVIAMDGQPCDPFDPLKRTVILAPGSRFDVIADLPRAAGKEAVLRIALGNGLPVLAITTQGETMPERPAPGRLEANDVPTAIRLQNAWRSELTIEGGLPAPGPDEKPDPVALETAAKAAFKAPGDIYTLNFGFKAGFDGAPLLKVKKGLPVVIAITNKTAWGQVIRLHGHVFRLLHNFDDGWEPYFLDTLYIPPGQISRIAFDARHIGKWAIRASIAEHFDAGIASWYEVTA